MLLIASLIFFMMLLVGGLIFMFRRILNQNVVYATKHLEELSEDYAQKEQEINRELTEAKEKSQETISQARDEAERLRQQMIKDAESQRDSILKQAHNQAGEIIKQADKTRQLLISELEKRIDHEAAKKACELIQVNLPDDFKRDIHPRWIEDLIENGFNQLSNLNVAEGINEAKVASALALDESVKKKISKKLAHLFGREIALKEEVDPLLIVGITVTIGSLVLDGSLRNKILSQAKDPNQGN